MAIEFERKFLLVSESWRAQVRHSQRIAQAYLNDYAAVAGGHEQCSVRVRIAGQNANLNIKSREPGARRQEFEYPIPLPDAEIELESVAESFAKPAWLGREVTEFQRYYNLALSSKPYSAWSAEEKSC